MPINKPVIWISRLLSAVLALFALTAMEHVHIIRSLVIYGFLLVCIWFPLPISEHTFGKVYRGYTINTASPPTLVAITGWILLVTIVVSQYMIGDWYSRLPQ